MELQFASFADVTLVVSPFEAKEVAARVPKANIKVYRAVGSHTCAPPFSPTLPPMF